MPGPQLPAAPGVITGGWGPVSSVTVDEEGRVVTVDEDGNVLEQQSVEGGL